LRWIAILFGRIEADLAGSGGVHHAEDAIKLLMAGANVAMMTSALLKSGIEYIARVENAMAMWLEEHEYESVEQLRGSVSQIHSEDPSAFERAQYMRGLKTYAV
jgi:dihydroorotate dehydrogenase (fumarate)